MDITNFNHLKQVPTNGNNQNCNPEDLNRLQHQIARGQQQCNSLSGMAQTASLGNHEMMTYINLPNPTSLNVTEPCGNGQNPSDEAGEFLDGLFDRMSGSGDNGSDRGEETNDSTVETEPQPTSDDNGRPGGNINFSSNPTNMMNGTGQDMHSNSASSDAAATRGAVGVQFPQHMLYGTNPNSTPLPQNLLQFQSPRPGQSNNSSNVTKIEEGNTNNNITTLPPWMISAVHPSISSINISATQQQTNPMNIAVQPVPKEQKPIVLSTPVVTNHCAITPQSTIIQSETQITKSEGHLSRKRSMPFSSCSSIDNTTTITNNEVDTTPSVATSSSGNNKRNKSTPPPVSEDEPDAQKRRRDRNQREQERSQRIATQIADLKDLLSQSNVAFKPDKYSTLVSVHEYIESLQKKNEILDQEHKGLLDTIASADEIVNQSMIGGKREEQVMADEVGSSSALSIGGTLCRGEGTDATDTAINDDADVGDYVKGLDYKSLILRCTVALCVSSIDGRLLVCNEEFVNICGLKREVLEASGLLRKESSAKELSSKVEDVTFGGNMSTILPSDDKTSTPSHVLSLFNLLSREDMGIVFEAMSSMLRSQNPEKSTKSRASSPLLHQWTGVVDSFSAMKRKIRLNVTLVREKCGTPKYFNCAVTPC